MRRYFYNEVGIISKWLEKNALAKLLEDSIYRSAFLSAYKLQPDHNLDDLKEIILNMTIPEQQKYANNQHIEALFNHFHILHRYSRGKSMIFDANRQQQTTSLVDPDKFPIWDLKKYSSVYQSLWGHYLAEIRYDLGFQPIIRQSQIEHPAGGRGTYLIVANNRKKVKVGEFLGLVPGKIYNNLNDFNSIVKKDKNIYHKQPQHLHFPSGKILQLGNISKIINQDYGLSISDNKQLVDGTFHNPYAFGHMINHPPPGCQPNVIFTQMNIKKQYFPNYLLRFLPYQDYTQNKKIITIFGIYAIKEIQHKQEIFVDYNQSHIYPIDQIPQWLLQPNKISPIFTYLKKGEYQLPQSEFWKAIEKRALVKNKQLLQKYQKQMISRPDKVEYQDSSKIIKKMKIRIQDDNHYEHL